jgi:hypothetical protein
MDSANKFRLAALSVLVVAASTSAEATQLTVVNVSAPAVNCVFNPSCKVTVTDTVAKFSWPGVAGSKPSGSLQSRTFTGIGPVSQGMPGWSKTAYLYRVQALTGTSVDCITGLAVDFGPIAQLDYNQSGKPSDVFVITKGGLGSRGIQSADQVGSTITFHFAGGVCNTVAQSTFFFGLAAATPPKSVTAQVLFVGSGNPAANANVAARSPTH